MEKSYDLVIEDSLPELISKVNLAIAEKYLPLGSPFFHESKWIQAIVSIKVYL